MTELTPFHVMGCGHLDLRHAWGDTPKEMTLVHQSGNCLSCSSLWPSSYSGAITRKKWASEEA